MAVYFIRAGEDGPVKIGITGDVKKRFHALQTANSARLALIRLIDGDTNVEREMHETFADRRIFPRSEWFHFDDHMLNVGEPLPIPSLWKEKSQTSFWDTVERLALDRLGVTKGAYAVWRTRNSVPHRFRLPLVTMSAGVITAADFDRLDAEGPRDQAAE